MADHPRDKHGVHSYSAEEFGIDKADIERRFGHYIREYGLES